VIGPLRFRTRIQRPAGIFPDHEKLSPWRACPAAGKAMVARRARDVMSFIWLLVAGNWLLVAGDWLLVFAVASNQ
jgi:hypothetical protein